MGRKELRNDIEFAALVCHSRGRVAFVLLPIFIMLIILLLCRLFYIQIICHDKFSEAVSSQYEISLTGLDAVAASDERRCDKGETVFALIARDRKDAALEELLRASCAENITKASSHYEVYEIAGAKNETIEKLRMSYDAYLFYDYRPRQSIMTVTGEPVQSEIILYADAVGNLIGGLPPQLRAVS